MTKPLPEIKKTVILNAPLDRVWEAVSTSKGLALWWMKNDLEPVKGHRFVLHAGPYGDSPCVVTEVEPLKLLKFDWDKDWQVKFELRALDDGRTEFTLTHSGWDADKKTKFGQDHSGVREIMNGGWDNHVMQNLPKSIQE